MLTKSKKEKRQVPLFLIDDIKDSSSLDRGRYANAVMLREYVFSDWLGHLGMIFGIFQASLVFSPYSPSPQGFHL